MEFSARTKKILLIVAAILVVAAVCLYSIADNSSTLEWVCNELETHGIRISPSQLNYEGNAQNTSIRELMVTEAESTLKAAIEASIDGGFESDIDAVGNIVLITGELESEDKLTVYIFENADKPMYIALCFIQNSTTGEVRSR